MEDLPDRSLQSKIAAIAIETAVVCEALRVTTEVELVVGLIPISEAGDQFGFVVAFKS